MSDFSLLDAVECGIVKLPRVPVADNVPGGDMPRYRELWKHIGPHIPKKGRRGVVNLDPLNLPADIYLVCTGGTLPGQLLYGTVADDACERIHAAIAGATAERRVRAVLDAYNPKGSTAEVDFRTSKTNRWRTNPSRCHVNWAICDSDWEAEFCRVAESHARVLAYVKNLGMGFTVPYRMGGGAHRYVPDFILRIDDGGDAPLHLVAEVKGRRGEDAKIKAQAMRAFWVPGVNALGTFGRWDFAEFPRRSCHGG